MTSAAATRSSPGAEPTKPPARPKRGNEKTKDAATQQPQERQTTGQTQNTRHHRQHTGRQSRRPPRIDSKGRPHLRWASLCIHGDASTAGGSSSASGPIMYRQGRRLRPRAVSANPQVVSRPNQSGEAFGAAEALRKPFHVEQARMRHQHRHFTPDTRGQGQEYKY